MKDKSAITAAAQKFAARGQTDEAIAEWSKLLDEGQDGNVLNTIGDLYLKKGSQKGAIQSYTKAANIYREDGFFPKALALYKKILNIDPNTLDVRIALAELNAEKGLTSQAVDELLKVADKYVQNGDAEKALETYEKVLRLTPADVNTKIKLTELSLKIGRVERASKGYAMLASDHLEKGETDKAREFYLKSIKTDPQNLTPLMGLSTIEENAGNLDGALEYLSKAVSLSPENRKIVLHYSKLASKADKTDEAKTVLSKLIEKDPSDIDAKKTLGMIYLQDKQYHNAWDSLMPFIDEAITLQNWDDALEMLNCFKEAQSEAVKQRLAAIHKAKGGGELPPEALQSTEFFDSDKTKTDFYSQQGLTDEASQKYKDIVYESTDDLVDSLLDMGLKERSAMGYAMVASDFLKKGELDQAKEFFLKSLDVDSNNVTTLVGLSSVSEKTNNLDKALEYLSKAAELKPDDGAIKKKIEELEHAKKSSISSPGAINAKKAEADFFAQQGLTDEAITIYKEILSFSPDNAEVKQALNALAPSESAGTSSAAGTDTAIDDILNEMADKGPVDYDAHFQSGVKHKQEGSLEKAIKEFQIAAKDPDKTVRNSRVLALCYIENGSFPNAVSELEKISQAMSPDENAYLSVLYELANAYSKNSDIDKARQAYEKIQAKDPVFKDVSAKLESLKHVPAAKPQPKAASEKPKAKKKDRISYL